MITTRMVKGGNGNNDSCNSKSNHSIIHGPWSFYPEVMGAKSTTVYDYEAYSRVLENSVSSLKVDSRFGTSQLSSST